MAEAEKKEQSSASTGDCVKRKEEQKQCSHSKTAAYDCGIVPAYMVVCEACGAQAMTGQGPGRLAYLNSDEGEWDRIDILRAALRKEELRTKEQ